MEDVKKYDISFSGEFVDKTLEREFFHNDMKYYSKLIGPVALIFGVIYMLFVIPDYFAIENPYSFMVILIIRALFLIVSAVIYFATKEINNYANLAYLITGYEVWAIVSFLVIIYQYESLGFIVFFSIVAITFAIYITPNKLTIAQILSVFFNLFFFSFFTKRIENLETYVLLKIIAYNLVFIIFSNIGAYLTNFYKRKQFADRRELLRLSITDSLTGIYNRTKFDRELNWWVDYCNRYKHPLSLVIFDIDDFKSVNDNYGHLIGDNIIQDIASTVKTVIRRTDIFARWGGEEFVILLPNTGIDQAVEMTERMRIFIQESRHDKVENTTCSFGLVSQQKDESAQSMLQRADKLLYKAKGLGKNTVVCDAGI